jgi:hypothetical protein
MSRHVGAALLKRGAAFRFPMIPQSLKTSVFGTLRLALDKRISWEEYLMLEHAVAGYAFLLPQPVVVATCHDLAVAISLVLDEPHHREVVRLLNRFACHQIVIDRR